MNSELKFIRYCIAGVAVLILSANVLILRNALLNAENKKAAIKETLQNRQVGIDAFARIEARQKEILKRLETIEKKR